MGLSVGVMQNTYTVSNKFTGYKATIRISGNKLPSVATLEKHFRKAKASDCKSSTKCRDDQTGAMIVIENMGHGKEVVRY